MKKFMFFLLAAMLGIVAANAQITQGRIGTGDITISGTDWTDVYGLDFDNDGTLEFRIQDYDGGSWDPTITNGYLSYNWTDGGNNIAAASDYAELIGSGVAINSSTEFGGAGDAMIESSSLAAGTYYMGFRISLSDGVHYGWAECTVAENGDDYDITWTKCYYNATVGESIVTGDEGGSGASCDVAAGDLPYSFGFETLDCWEQQQINGSSSWSATTSSNYSVIQGTKYAFISSTTEGYQTRLISPTFNVNGVPNLTLKFAHAHKDWAGDQDSLKVEYRLSPTSEWQTLATYKNSVTAFEFASIPLPETSSTLQIAFHAYLEYGRGIAIDSLTLVSVSCQAPAISDITATDNTATVTWSGSASQYGITLNDGAEEVLTETSKTFTGLTANTSYSISLRAICGGEGSEVVSQTFRTQCGAETTPYSENFDAMTTSEAPNCWTVVQSYASYSATYPIVSTTAGRTTNGLYFSATTTYSNLIASPMLDRNANTCLVAFDAKLANYDDVLLITGVMTNPGDASTFVALDTIYGNVNAATWKSYEVDLSIYDAIATSEAKYVAFKFDGNYDYGYMDNLAIRQAPSCKKPSGLEAAATNNSLTMSWTENGSATKWVVKVGDGEWTEVRDNPYEIAGLTANTDYAVSVRAFCDPDTSDAVSGTFRTLCDAEDFPYSENFESFTASNVPDCWTNIAGTTTVVENGSYSTYAYDGTKALSISGGGVIASPVINVNRSDVYVNFELKRSSSYAGTLAVGIAASPALVNDAVYFDTIEPDNTNYANYEYIFHNTLNLTSGCLIFKQLESTSTYYYFYIDSLTVSEPPACAKPINLALDEATENSLTLSWTENGSATKWVVKVDDGEWTETTDNPKTINGLEANTEYTISVRAFCDPDTSDAVSGTFRTLCATQTTPYEENFTSHTAGSAPYCWTTVLANGTYPKIGNTASSATDGNYLELYGSYSNHLCMIASPILDRNANTLYLSFDAWLSNYTSDTLYVGVIDDVINAATFTSVFSLVGNQNGGTWKNYEINLSTVAAIASSTSKYIAFRFYGSSDYCRIDNIVVSEPPACAKPTDLTLDEATENSLTLSWIEAGSATKWVVKVNDGDWATVTENPYTISGLTANTEYAITVRAFCDPDTSDAVSGTFRTACATEVVTTDDSFEEEFEGITSGIPTCWAQTTTTWKSYATGNTGRGLYFTDYYGHVDTLITPEFNLSALTNGAQLRFWYKIPEEEDWYGDTYSATLQVLYRTSTSGEWTVGETLTETVEDWTEHEFVLPASSAAASYQIAFRAVSANDYTDTYVYLDGVVVEVAPSCTRPTDLAAATTGEEAVLTWTGDAAKYEVRYSADGVEWTSSEVTVNTTTITGLETSTNYQFEVRAICGDGDTSTWASVSARTACAAVAAADLPYFEGFESDISCWQQEAVTGSSATWELEDNGYYEPVEGASYVTVEAYSGNEVRLISPIFNVATVESLTMRFNHAQKAYSSSQDELTVEYRLSPSDAWVELAHYTENIESFQGETITIPQTSATMQIAFRAMLVNGYGVAIDSLSIYAGGDVPATCDVPTGLAASNVTENSAVINWTGNAAEYEVELNGQASTVATNSYNATGLTAATDYAVRVRALCDGGLTSDWTEMVNFTTLNGGEQPTECTTPTGLAVSNITETSASISWNEVAIAETFDGEWNLAMGAEDSVHTMITPDATMHTLLNALNMDFEDVDENVSVAGTLVPVTIEPAAGNQMNVTGSFDMAMYGVDDPVTFHFSTTGTVTSTGMTIEPATINETVRIMNAMDIDYTGTLTFVQPTALPENGTLTIGIASMNISGYGDTTVNVGIAMTGSVSISMVGTDLTASGSRETTNTYPTYELVVTNVATGVETPITNATTPYALEGLTASTEYTVKVRTHCDENSTSEWSAAVPFTTLGGQQPVECDVPTNVATSNITATAVTVSWTGTASEYQIEVSDGGATPIMQTVSASPYTVEGLTASTDYTVRVRALCENDETSDWSAAVNFTTLNGEQPQGIDDVNGSYSVSIYPNPASEKVTVSVDGLSGKAQVSVIDMSGRTVMTSTMESDATQLNVSKLAQGTYFVRINGENISTVRKLVVR